MKPFQRRWQYKGTKTHFEERLIERVEDEQPDVWKESPAFLPDESPEPAITDRPTPEPASLDRRVPTLAEVTAAGYAPEVAAGIVAHEQALADGKTEEEAHEMGRAAHLAALAAAGKLIPDPAPAPPAESSEAVPQASSAETGEASSLPPADPPSPEAPVSAETAKTGDAAAPPKRGKRK